MPRYEFRCKNCGAVFIVNTRTYSEYDSARLNCPECGSADLARLISQVSISGLQRDYRKMSSGEMLSVLESGDQRQVGELFKQVGGGDPASGAAAKDLPITPGDVSKHDTN